MPNYQGVWSLSTQYQYAADWPSPPATAIYAGGYLSGSINVIESVLIVNSGNTSDFGDLTVARRFLAGMSSSTRGVFAGGGGSASNVIDYVTIATAGNATDFGDTTAAMDEGYAGGFGSESRGIYAGGYQSSTAINNMEYVTIASTGNGTDFGNLSQARTGNSSGFCSPTRGGLGGGNTGGGGGIQNYTTQQNNNIEDSPPISNDMDDEIPF